MIKPEDVYQIGRVGKPHGVDGEVNMAIDDDVFDRVEADFLILEVDGLLVPFFIDSYRFRSDTTVLMKFCDVDSMDEARELTGCDVFFPRAQAEEADGDVAWSLLTGYMLHDKATHSDVGRIASIDDSTLNILFCMDDGRLIPASEQLVEAIDTKKKVITVNLPEGILDL